MSPLWEWGPLKGPKPTPEGVVILGGEKKQTQTPMGLRAGPEAEGVLRELKEGFLRALLGVCVGVLISSHSLIQQVGIKL